MAQPLRSVFSSRPGSARPPARGAADRVALEVSLPAAALVLANLVPVFGVLFFGWSAFDVLQAYWMESGVVGFYAIARILIAGGGSEPERGLPLGWMLAMKVFLACFFVVHFGFFMFGHGVFLFAMFGTPEVRALGVEDMVRQSAVDALRSPLVWALFASHGCAFVIGFLRGGAYRRMSFMAQMFAPYPRIVAMHLTIILGAVPMFLLNAPAAMIAVLVAAKVAVELKLLGKGFGDAATATTSAY